MYSIVTKINSELELLENNISYVDVIDDNGSIIIQHAYNVAENTTSESDVKIFEIPHSLHVFFTKFLDTYSGYYHTAYFFICFNSR